MSIRPAPPRAGGEDELRPDGPPATRSAPQPAKPAPTGANGQGPVGGRPGLGRRRTITYDDQARRPTRRGPVPPPVEVRRVRRIVRRVDTWSVFRFAVVLYVCGLIVFEASVAGLWLVATSAGAIPSIEHFVTQLFALKHFHFKAFQLLVGTFGVGLVWVFAATLFTVVTAVLYNLISDVVGGIELTMLEEQPLDITG